MPILCLGLSHRTAPVTLRERFAFAEGRIPEALARLRSSGAAEEAVILSTCNRVELYVATAQEPRQAFAALRLFLRDWHGFTEPFGEELYELAEPRSEIGRAHV